MLSMSGLAKSPSLAPTSIFHARCITLKSAVAALMSVVNQLALLLRTRDPSNSRLALETLGPSRTPAAFEKIYPELRSEDCRTRAKAILAACFPKQVIEQGLAAADGA